MSGLDMSHVYRVSHFLHRPMIKLEREIKTLQLNYDADFKTADGDEKKIEKLKKKFNEKNTFLTNRKEAYHIEIEDYVKMKALEDNSSSRHVSKMQLFMDTLKELEGENKKAVLHQTLVQTLCDDEFGNEDYNSPFTRESANDMIRRMIREASIYESRPGFYNRV